MGSTVAERITEFVEGTFLVNGRDAALSIDTPLIESGIIDSLGVVEIVAFLEDEFSIEVDDEEIVPENMNSVGQLTAFVAGKAGQ